MRKLLIILLMISASAVYGQFGRNKIQYYNYDWYYIQTAHFDIYFTKDAVKAIEFAAAAAEDAVTRIEKDLKYSINNRIAIIFYNSQNEFQETNVTDSYLSEGIGGFTELFKNRVVLPFTGNYKMFRHVIHHELVHAVMNDMFYGGSLQNVISNNININIPLWFSEGLAEYLSLGWDTNTDMFIRDAAMSEYLPDIPQLGGYFAYRGGQAVFHYIAERYGREKVGELVSTIRSRGNFDAGFKASLGMDLEEFNERWKKEIKRMFWPDITKMQDPDEFSKRLTDHRKDGSSYNTSPALSPNGEKVAFISNKDYYFDVYVMNAVDGKGVKRIVKGNRTVDFEELNILTPGITWSPDGTKVAIAAKSAGGDAVFIVDADDGDVETLPFLLPGIEDVDWSKDGKHLAFAAHKGPQSDIYIYNFETQELKNLTDDVFSDSDPYWSPDGKTVFYSSDRSDVLKLGSSFRMWEHDFHQMDVFSINVESKKVTRLTDYPYSDEKNPIVSPDGKTLLFVSDYNGINNIYRKDISNGNGSDEIKAPPVPVTNSLNGLEQISISADGKRLVMNSMYQAGYDIFLLNNPFDTKPKSDTLVFTPYMTFLRNGGAVSPEKTADTAAVKIPVAVEKPDSADIEKPKIEIFTGQVLDSVDNSGKDYSTYVFGNDIPKGSDSSAIKDISVPDNLDDNGNYKVRKYKINFSPDLIYANAGYSTFYGLLGTTVLSFSDMLGDHKLVGITSLQIDLKNSDYGLAYFYLRNRLDLGIEAFHTARFVYLERGSRLDLYRYRNYGAVFSASYPINRFYRIDMGLSLLNVSQDNLDNLNESSKKSTFLVPSVSLVYDNSIFGYTAPIDGSRYRLDLMANPIIDNGESDFYTVMADYRNYLRFWNDYSFAMRFSMGYSFGSKPQRFIMGGIDNWINRQWTTNQIPLEDPSDFAFLGTAMPLRGFNYAERIGSKYSLVNLELRFPLIRYLLTGALPILFRDVMGTVFFDAGAAWNNNRSLQLFAQNAQGKTVTKDLLMGTGFGARLYFLYFLLRFDVAWSWDVDSFSKPVFYFSLGTDF
ncbi:MAG: PD40 domain-containing protein [Ignavibacteriaceae bacterium]|nr:PD40 domain-containing protein [Ignavibacteriaceae bacterium]